MPEQINLSDALDLIMQSKTDIKSSVQNKGSEIGDDLTQYAQSIDNIQFRSLQFKNNDTGDMQTSFDVSRYNDTANVSVQQYINGETSYPVNTSYTVSGTSISVTKNTPGTNKQVYRCVPTNYGTTILTIQDTVGNVEYPIALHVPVITIYGDYNNTMSGFDSFQWDENIPVEGGGGTTTGWNAAWDTSVQQNPNFTAIFSFNDSNGHNVDTSNLSFDITGDVIDAGLVTVTYVTSASTATFTFTPYYNNDDSQYEYYNGVINIAISDGTSTGDIAPIYLTGGEDIPDEQTNPQSISEVKQLEDNAEFTFDGTVTVITKTSNNRELYIQDADGTAGIQIYQTNIGSSFAAGDVIYSGWSGTKYTYSGASSIKNTTDLNYSGDTTTVIANERTIQEISESDVYNYVVIRNIIINENNIVDETTSDTLSIYNKFAITIPSDAQHYDAYGLIKWQSDNPQLWPMSFEPVGGDEPTGASFTYDGSDQNSPIQVNVDLSAFAPEDVRIMPNLSAPEGIQYDWGSETTWTPDIGDKWYSNTNDFPIMGRFEGGGDFNPVDDTDMDMNQIWKDGPTTAGTYLKSYTCTFVYNKDYSEKYDETTNEQLDDPIAQALDGTVVTFWVQYNVTGAYPEPENP